tara:strand:- start:1173 stop:2501 length:1329 start_codon:yes stop_codon:yes gene_type:complete
MNISNKIFLKKKILIYGLGKSGISSYNFLKKKNTIFLYDDLKKKFKIKNLNKKFIKRKDILRNKFDYIVISPGIDINKCKLKKYLKKNYKKIITDLDIFYSHYFNNKIISITGTNGKSTTSKLLHLILKHQNFDTRICGNIGRPILLEKNISKKTIFVIEVSSYQLEYSKIFKTNYAIILNISVDHLERHKSMQNYVNAKFKLVANQKKKDFAFINFNNKYLKKLFIKNKINSKLFKINLKIFKKYKKKILNKYFLTYGNQENLSFIFSICEQLKLNMKRVIKTINEFKGLKYRQELIFKNKNLTLINDSKATSFESSINALKPLKKVLWIVGGIPKFRDKFTLKKTQCKNITVYIFGKNKNFFVNQFKNKVIFYYFKNLETLIKKILQDAKLKTKNSFYKNILFSPAAASFDSFKSFEERGEYFNFLIKKYKLRKVFNVIK